MLRRSILQKMKKQLVEDMDLKRADHLLDWLEENRYFFGASEPVGAEARSDEGAERFKKYWRERFEKRNKMSDWDVMKKLIKMLKVKHKVFLSQGQNGTDAKK